MTTVMTRMKGQLKEEPPCHEFERICTIIREKVHLWLKKRNRDRSRSLPTKELAVSQRVACVGDTHLDD